MDELKDYDTDLTLFGEPYTNNQVQIPLFQTRYIQCKGNKYIPLHIPRYNPNSFIAEDEVFVVIDDRVVNNIIPNRYLVSTYGRVFDRVTGNFLKFHTNNSKLSDGTSKPYYMVRLVYYKSWNETGSAFPLVHRVVMLTFKYIPYAEFPELSKLEVNHKNFNRLDNRLTNLEWIDKSGNVKHSYNNGMRNNRSKFVNPNLSLDDPNQPIRKVCSLLEQGYGNTEIANITGLNRDYIGNVRRGKIYQEYSKDYNMPPSDHNGLSLEYKNKIIKACEMLQAGYKNIDIVNALGLRANTVCDIKHYRSYEDISCNYTW